MLVCAYTIENKIENNFISNNTVGTISAENDETCLQVTSHMRSKCD